MSSYPGGGGLVREVLILGTARMKGGRKGWVSGHISRTIKNATLVVDWSR